MSDITVTAAKVAPVFPDKAEIYDAIAAAAITAGQAVYITSAGKVNLADADGSGTTYFRGIALNGAGAGQAVSVLLRGAVYGFTLSGANYDAKLYVSNTAGALADAAGSTSLVVGRVMPLADKDLTKVLFVEGAAG